MNPACLPALGPGSSQDPRWSVVSHRIPLAICYDLVGCSDIDPFEKRARAERKGRVR